LAPGVMSNPTGNRRSPLGLFSGQPTARLHDCVVEALRTRRYSRRTEEAYLHPTRRFLAFHNGTHPREMAETDVNRFPTHLAAGANVAASAENQVLALLFLYKAALEQPLDGVEGVLRARKPKRRIGNETQCPTKAANDRF